MRDLKSRVQPHREPSKGPIVFDHTSAGWPIWPLLLCSVVALALVLERCHQPASRARRAVACSMK
jgi:hypothetical protein